MDEKISLTSEQMLEILRRYNFWDGQWPNLGFERLSYLDRLESAAGSRLIKILVGQRRVGKSYLLRQLAFRLVGKGVNPRNLFFLNKEFTDFDFVANYHDLVNIFKLYLSELKPQGRIYLFIDEIQNIEGWEKFVNSYSQDYTGEYELFISGSNSNLLSGELATLLSGRFIQLKVYPFSYDEYANCKELEVDRQSYMRYMADTGMPETLWLPNEEIKTSYMQSLKDTIVLRDIITRKAVKDPQLLDLLFAFAANSASNLISITNIANYISSNRYKTSYETVDKYLGYFAEAFTILSVERYNLEGKEILNGPRKYYLNDQGFRNYLYRGYAHGIGYQLENLVYIELLRHGYDVYVGALPKAEIDFVAIKGDRKIYIQVTYLMEDPDTQQREYKPLLSIRDNYEKWVVSLDDLPRPNINGILNIPAWTLINHLD